MGRWVNEHVMMLGALASSMAFVFTTFASIKYVDDKHNEAVREIDQLHKDNLRIEAKVDLLLERKRR